jgi:hypothetical protein
MKERFQTGHENAPETYSNRLLSTFQVQPPTSYKEGKVFIV